jgi:hypothetical protein
MSLPFNSIDYSYDNGWTGVYSIKIDNTGKTYILGEDINKGKLFVRTEITSKSMDSLFTLVNKINSANLDTLYKKNCEDCGYYYLIIKKQSEVVKLFVQGRRNNDNDLMEVNKLSDYLESLISETYDNVKSVKFESRTSAFNPVPPPPLFH